MKNALIVLSFLSISILSQGQSGYQYSWKYFTTGNTGILGDYSEALWIGDDGDPYIAAYTPGWEEGGFSKYLQSENHWNNFSNVEFPVIGSIYDVGSSRIADIVEDANGTLWMATWRGLLKFDPSVGPASLQFWGANNSLHPGGRTMDIDIAPDGSVWGAIQSVTWGSGGLIHYNPSTNVWQYWGYGSSANNWPSLIGFCEHVSIQDKPTGGYTVWIDGEGWNTMIAFDSDTQLFTLLPQNLMQGEVVALPGDDCIDDEGNLWALRYTTPGNPFSLDYRTPAGNWVTPGQPSAVLSDIWVFKAFGNHEAMITGLNSEIFQFSGSSWLSKGIWREGAYTYALDIDNAGNIWASGVGGVARRDVATGFWQRYRITNTSQIDYWVQDICLDNEGNAWMTGNAGTGIGGFQKFNGTSWMGFNEENYGMGHPFPFNSDNTQAIFRRPSNGDVIFNPTYNGLHGWNGTSYFELLGSASVSKGITEDSDGRLWNLGEYYSLQYFSNNAWNPVTFVGSGTSLLKDPTRPATIWACSGFQALRTDGMYSYAKNVNDFVELDPQSDVLTTAVPSPDGIAWIGSNKGLFKVNSNNNTYQYYNLANSSIPGENVTPLVSTPDGRIWFTTFGSADSTLIGLCWFDGTSFGFFPVVDGGLPHAQIKDAEIRVIPGGYELWMSCLSRGIAVLKVLDASVGVASNDNSGFPDSFRIFPNPFSSGTSVDFSLSRPGFVQISVFGMTGELVKILENEYFDKGKFQVEWNGTNTSNNEVPPGIYMVQLKTGSKLETLKIVRQ